MPAESADTARSAVRPGDVVDRRAGTLARRQTSSRPRLSVGPWDPPVESLEPRRLLSVTFLNQRTYPAGHYPDAVAVANLGNGHPDLVVANGTDNTVGVYLGNGDGTFQSPVTYPTATDPTAVAVADLGNGHPDLIVTNYFSNSVSVFLGNGDGTFQPRRDFSVGTNPFAVAVADLGNGEPDVIVANNGSNTVGVLLGTGDGNLLAQQTFAAGTGPDAVAVGNLGNGHPDLVIANRGSNNVSILLGNGNGTFQAQSTAATGSSPDAVILANLGNGQSDIVVANALDNTLSVLLGNGDGTFQAQSTVPTGGIPYALATADLGDPHTDLVVANESDDTVGVLVGNGNGTFQPQKTYPTGLGPVAIAADDLGNGKTSVVTANSSGNSVSVLVGGAGTASASAGLTASPNPALVGAAVTLTANVAPATGSGSGTPPTPTGFVTFLNGTTQVDSVANLTNGVATLTTSDLPQGTNVITAQYSGDANYAPSTSAGVNVVVATTLPTSQTLSASLSGKVPASVVAGQPLGFKETLTFKAGAAAIRGNASASVLLSPDANASDAVLTLASAKSKLNLKALKTKGVALKLPKALASTVKAGAYNVLIQLTDTKGATTTISSGQTFNVVAPQVDLSGSFVKVPTTATAGKKFSFTFLITNSSSANVAASATLPIAIGVSTNNNPSNATLVADTKKKVSIKPGKSVRVTFAVPLASTGYLVARVDPDNSVFADDLNYGNNSFISAQPITLTS